MHDDVSINWKQVAASPGYKSLKAAYVRDVQKSGTYRSRFGTKPLREKEEFLKLFNWVIARAKHYAHHLQCPIEDVLNKWEEGRGNHWWLNYYQNCHQPKFHGDKLKYPGVVSERKRLKQQSLSRRYKRLAILRALQSARPKRTKKPRWSVDRKKRSL
jgi:hypothetical protein